MQRVHLFTVLGVIALTSTFLRRPALPHATSDAVYSEDINGFESDKLALFVNTVSHLERESAWLFARMETMAEELASADRCVNSRIDCKLQI